MLIKMEVDVDRHPDMVGEYLRFEFFNEQKPGDVGCYSVFDWREGVEELESFPVEPADYPYIDLMWIRSQKNGIECRYYWDGDGTLAFRLEDGRWLINSDCKKSYGWKVAERPDYY